MHAAWLYQRGSCGIASKAHLIWSQVPIPAAPFIIQLFANGLVKAAENGPNTSRPAGKKLLTITWASPAIVGGHLQDEPVDAAHTHTYMNVLLSREKNQGEYL